MDYAVAAKWNFFPGLKRLTLEKIPRQTCFAHKQVQECHKSAIAPKHVEWKTSKPAGRAINETQQQEGRENLFIVIAELEYAADMAGLALFSL